MSPSRKASGGKGDEKSVKEKLKRIKRKQMKADGRVFVEKQNKAKERLTDLKNKYANAVKNNPSRPHEDWDTYLKTLNSEQQRNLSRRQSHALASLRTKMEKMEALFGASILVNARFPNRSQQTMYTIKVGEANEFAASNEGILLISSFQRFFKKVQKNRKSRLNAKTSHSNETCPGVERLNKQLKKKKAIPIYSDSEECSDNSNTGHTTAEERQQFPKSSEDEFQVSDNSNTGHRTAEERQQFPSVSPEKKLDNSDENLFDKQFQDLDSDQSEGNFQLSGTPKDCLTESSEDEFQVSDLSDTIEKNGGLGTLTKKVDYSFAGNLHYSDATETSGNVRILRGATKESLPKSAANLYKDWDFDEPESNITTISGSTKESLPFDSRKTVSGKESDKSKGMKTTLNSSKSLSSVRKSSENPDCREPTDVIKQSLSVKRTGKIIQKVPHEIQKKPVGEKVTQNVNHNFPSDSQPKNPKRDKLSAVQQPLSVRTTRSGEMMQQRPDNMQKMTKKTKLTQKSNKNLSSDLPPENLDNGQVGVIQQSLSATRPVTLQSIPNKLNTKKINLQPVVVLHRMQI